MSRIRRGWELTRKSWAVLQENQALIRFPLYGAVATVLMAVIVVVPGLYLIDQGTAGGGVALLIIAFYLLALIGFYFSVGLAAAAEMIFHGQRATVGEGLAVARGRISQMQVTTYRMQKMPFPIFCIVIVLSARLKKRKKRRYASGHEP